MILLFIRNAFSWLTFPHHSVSIRGGLHHKALATGVRDELLGVSGTVERVPTRIQKSV